jgi:predicted adenine nucleotide alpha hydrolase (AANH) superfamily ATPase
VCAGSTIERLINEGNQVTGFFFNPNIHPYKEYCRRRTAVDHIKETLAIPIIEGTYDPKLWFTLTKDYATSCEGGARCQICIELRLQETYRFFAQGGFDYFTTTLSVSPHKQSKVIFEIGKRLGGEHFLSRDFKKQEGFKQAIDFSKQHSLYRQDYCGCIYSFLDKKKNNKLHTTKATTKNVKQ